jgi:tRNA pseudouridine13 synthase
LDVVGFAGMKDRLATTRQAFTVPLARPVRRLEDGMVILERARTARRLKLGELAGNRFHVRVRGGDATAVNERLSRLPWMPNYYGVQRTGSGAPEQGRALLLGHGPELRHRELKFALSAYQSSLFNRVLAERGGGRLTGDLEHDGVPTGPMYGSRMPWPGGAARALEERVLAAEALPTDAWHRFGKLTLGTRRALWVKVDAEVEATSDGFWLRFSLPSGSYATVLLEELL